MSDVLIVINKVVERNCRQGDLRNNIFFLEIIQAEGPSLLEYVESVAKTYTGLMNTEMRGRLDNPLPLENFLRGLLQAPISNLVQSFSISIGETLPQSKQKT